MSKRQADHQITKDEYEGGAGEEDAEQDGTWQQASEDKLATRTFVKVKRKERPPAASSGAMPTFSFGAPAAAPAAAPAPAAAAAPTAPAVTEAPKLNAFAMAAAKNKPSAFAVDNWECPGCYLSNKKELAKCPSCETPNPALGAPTEPTAPAAATTFGGVASSTGASFAFGAPASSGATFSFGAPASTGVTFGSAGGAAMTFGGVAGDGVASWAKPAEDSKSEPFATATFGASDGPKEEFKDKKAEASGEETDQLLLKVYAKVYTLKPVEAKEGEADTKAQTKFVESGVGDLRFNKYTVGDTVKCRVVLRVDKTQRLVLNAPLVKGMTKELQGDKFVRFTSVDLEGQMAVFLLKFKAKTDAQTVFKQMESCVSSIITETPKK